MIYFRYYDSLPSTMDEASDWVLKGAREGTVIVASCQTAGRGRRGRVWESLQGNLYFTYITYQECSVSKGLQLSFVACVAVGEAMRSFLPPGSSLLYKWPNDLLLNGKKVGGILLEVRSIPERQETGYLIGCGINLIFPPQEARYPATSFQSEGIFLPYEDSLHKIATSLQSYISLWQKEGFSPIHNLWMKNAMGLGTHLCLDLDGQQHAGVCQGITMDGSLILETPQGVVKLMAGEILENRKE